MNKTDKKYIEFQDNPYVRHLQRKIKIKDNVIKKERKKRQAMKTEIIKMRREILDKVKQLEEAVKDIMYVNDIFDRIKEDL